MNITRIIRHGLFLSAALWIVGCSTPHPTDLDLIEGWKCLYQTDPADYGNAENSLDEHLHHDYKAILDDSRDFIKKLERSSGISASDPDRFFMVTSGKFYEDGAGQHAVMYMVRIKTRWFDTVYTYLLLYDKSNKRTKVIKEKSPYPSSGFGQIKSKFLKAYDSVA
jgi:hypothetical protein